MGAGFLVITCGLMRGNNYFASTGGNSQSVTDFTFYLDAAARDGEYSLYNGSNRLMFVSRANWLKYNGVVQSGCGLSVNGNFTIYNGECASCFAQSSVGTIPENAAALLNETIFLSNRNHKDWNSFYYCKVNVVENFVTLYKRYCKNSIGGNVSVSSSKNNTSDDKIYWNVEGNVVFTATPNEGYIIKGFKNSDGDMVSSSNVFSIPQKSYQDYELTPIFLFTYSVSFSANGGEGSMDPQQFVESEKQKLNINTFTRTGFIFTGWNTQADGSGESFVNGASVLDLADTAGEVITLYAQWRQVDFSLSTSFSLPDGIPAQTPEISITPVSESGLWSEGTPISISAQIDGLLGIEFDSWNISGVTVADITKNPLEFTMPSNDVTLTAVYKLKLLKVNHGIDSASKIAADGETSIVDETGSDPGELIYGDTVTFHAPDPTEGCYFSGWYNGNERVSQNRNYTVVLTGDISLLARYSTEVTVSKNEDGGTGYISVDGVGYESSEAVSIRKELGASMQIAAVATSGAFGGWYDGEAILELFRDDTVVITGKSTYAARFIAEAVTVQVKCRSVKNSNTDDGALGTLALAGPGVTDNGNGSYSVEGFTEVVLTATQADGGLPLFRVVEEVGEVESEIDISKPIWILSSDRTFIARWGSKGKFQVQVSSADNAAGMAYIGESAAVTSLTGEQDSTVTITALPSNGYRFVGWYEGDRLVSEKARYSFALVEPVSLQARFAEDAAAICVWEGSGENKRLSWKSKVFVMPRPFDPVAARVDATGYPVSLSVGTYSSPDAVPTRDHDVQVQNQAGRRLPRMRAERFLRISVESAHEVDSVVVATNLVEVN